MQRAGIAGSFEKVRLKVLIRRVTERVGMYPICNGLARDNDAATTPFTLSTAGRALDTLVLVQRLRRYQGSKAQPCLCRRAISGSIFFAG